MSDDKRPQLSPWPCPMPRAPSSSLPKALDANPSADANPSGWWSQSWPEPWAKHLCSPAISPISGISFSTRAHQKSSGVGALAPPCLPSPGSTFGSLVLALTQAPLRVFSLYGFQVHIRLFSSQCYSQEDHSLWWSHPSARKITSLLSSPLFEEPPRSLIQGITS